MNRAAGLTLIEVLVAMTLVLLVVAGAVTFVTRGRAAHRTGESLARLEEALDAGFSLLVDETRMSGYLGLAPPRSPVIGASTESALRISTTFLIRTSGNSVERWSTQSPWVAG